jgi:hypothetical protein
MALTRMRWTNTGAELIRSQARDGAELRQIDEPRPPRRRDIHIYLPAAKTADQAAPAGGLPAARKDQNVEPEEAGFRDRGGIKLTGRDQQGRNWSATIYSPHGSGWAAEEHDPDALTSSTGDANACNGGCGEHPAGQEFTERMAKIISPSTRTAADRGPASLRGLQKLLDEHYRRK